MHASLPIYFVFCGKQVQDSSNFCFIYFSPVLCYFLSIVQSNIMISRSSCRFFSLFLWQLSSGENFHLWPFVYQCTYVCTVFELSKTRGGGRHFSLGGGVERRGGGVEFFFDTGLKKRGGVEEEVRG